MVVYSLLVLAVAILFLALGIALYRGNTKLIHDYHQTKVRESDRPEYSRAFAKGMFAISLTLFLSGILALFDSNGAVVVSLIVLFAGLIVSIVILAKTQKKYNGGMF